VIGYVVDDAALVAGLGGSGTEAQRRELSRLVHASFDGGPPLSVPALCLASAVAARPAIADHTSMLVAQAPASAMEIRGLVGGEIAEILGEHPALGFAGAHAVSAATRSGAVVITVDCDRYAGVPVAAIAL
jgi:hypothetical protein